MGHADPGDDRINVLTDHFYFGASRSCSHSLKLVCFECLVSFLFSILHLAICSLRLPGDDSALKWTYVDHKTA